MGFNVKIPESAKEIVPLRAYRLAVMADLLNCCTTTLLRQKVKLLPKAKPNSPNKVLGKTILEAMGVTEADLAEANLEEETIAERKTRATNRLTKVLAKS